MSYWDPILRQINDKLALIQRENEEYYNKLDKLGNEILAAVKSITPPTPPPPQTEIAGFTVSITDDQQGEKNMALPKRAAKLAASITENDDGTASLNIGFVDTDGLPITTLTAWPTAVALATAAFSDATPGPSSLGFTQSASPVASTAVPGSFVAGTIVPAQAPSPLPPGWGQNVDVQVTIASGLTNQTAPITMDAGTISVTADSTVPAGFSVSVTEP
jgi:hypothetical protein